MAKRIKKTTLSDDWKARIQGSQIMNRLMGHVNGEIELTATQVNAAKILLGKVIPDLKSTEMSLTGKDGGPVENKLTVEFIKNDKP